LEYFPLEYLPLEYFPAKKEEEEMLEFSKNITADGFIHEQYGRGRGRGRGRGKLRQVFFCKF